MDFTILDLLSSGMSLFIVITGISLGIYTYKVYRKNQQSSYLLSSILFITLPLPYSVDIFYILDDLFSLDLSHTTLGMISGWSVPILATTWIFITAILYKEKYPTQIKILTGVNVVLGLLFWYQLFVVTDFQLEPIPNSVLFSLIYGLIPTLIIAIYAIIALSFIFPSYMYFSIKSTDPLFKIRSKLIAFGALLFPIGGLFDAIVVDVSLFTNILIRIIILSSLLCLYLGYNTPDRIRNKYST
ncbi:MAG: hypothetical protein OEZ01_09080 [Candidatus Heimdallarchaeota archaeon]|nr:hypothetical protein [Candidatus Heimdallarchaeota archaeon]MDH5646147.1 hypothetical protein [Candidatus Heimdallarchaeota archaeon]